MDTLFEGEDQDLLFAVISGKVSNVINKQLSKQLKTSGLEINTEQWMVLWYLWYKDGLTQQELCNATCKDKPTMTRLIDFLEKQNLVVRIVDKNDRRTNLIHLTKAGKEMKEKANEAAQTTCQQALNGINNQDLLTCQNVLHKVLENISSC